MTDNNSALWRLFAEGLVKKCERRTIRLVMQVGTQHHARRA
jgi:hypothetical protein